MSCLICAEDYDTNRHSEVSCMYCNFTACRTCCQTYILDQECNRCMNPDKNEQGELVCGKIWSRKFVKNNFPDSWIKKKWRTMNEKIGLEREQALMPATMVEFNRRKEEDEKKKQLALIKQQIQSLIGQKWRLEQDIQFGSKRAAEKNFVAKRCPDENCRGYLSSQLKCGVCDMWTCSECLQIKGPNRDSEHTCNPDDVATAKMLKNETRPCPKCTTSIYKIDGCDQMWCTQCHTAFSWRTGVIQTRIHNPHYYEWQRNNNGGTAPRNIGDIECGRDLGDGLVHNSLREILKQFPFSPANKDAARDWFSRFGSIIRDIIHLESVDLIAFHTDDVLNNMDLRIDYLNGKYDEKKFKSHILRRDKAFEKKREIYDVGQLHVRGVTDIIYRLHSELRPIYESTVSPEEVIHKNVSMLKSDEQQIFNLLRSYRNEITNITKYCNNLLEEHAFTYDCKNYRIAFRMGRLGSKVLS